MALEELGDHRDHAGRALAPGPRRGRSTAARELDRGVVGVRHGAVAGRAGRAQPRPDDALLGHLDGVEAAPAERDRVAADLVDGRGRRAPCGVVEQLRTLRRPGRARRAAPRPPRRRRPRRSRRGAARRRERRAPSMTPSSMATMFFMSTAPRPHTTPSTSSPPNGSRDHDSASTGTTSRCESRMSGGSVAAPVAGMRATHEPRPGVSSITSASMPASPRISAQ